MNKRPEKLVLASNNSGKLREFQAMFATFNIEIIPQSAFNVPEVEEIGLTFVENAILKARNAAQHSGLAALADDSGIEVDALNGQPGIYSARYAGTSATDALNNEKLLAELTDVPTQQRTARFQCIIACLEHEKDPTPLIFNGSWEGRILEKEDGDGGFGYDPLFYIATHNCTAATLEPTEKNRISHRGIALNKLLQHFECVS